MLKEVGASGQISLGKRVAGQLYEVVFHADGRVEMLSMKAVPAPAPLGARSLPTKPEADPAAWVPPGYAQSNPWAEDNRAALEAYAARVDIDGTAAEQMQRFLAQPAPVGGT